MRGYGTTRRPGRRPFAGYDFSNPLTRELRYAFYSLETSLSKTSLDPNVRYGPPILINNGGHGTTDTNDGGMAIVHNLNNSGYDSQILQYNILRGSVVWKVRPAFTFNDGTIHYFWGALQPGGVLPEFSCQKYSDSNWYLGWNVTGADRRIVLAASSSNLTQNQWQTYALAWDTTGSFFYRNGILIGSNGTAPSIPGSVTSSLVIGFVNNPLAGQTNEGVGTLIDFWGLWSRRLSGQELIDLTASPNILLRSTGRAR